MHSRKYFNMKPVEAVIFDYDGTLSLWDNNKAVSDTFQVVNKYLRKEYGTEISIGTDEFYDRGRRSGTSPYVHRIVKRIVEAEGFEIPDEVAVDAWRAWWRVMRTTAKRPKGTILVLELLKEQGKRLAIFTSLDDFPGWKRKRIQEEGTDIIAFFDAIVICGVDTPKTKLSLSKDNYLFCLEKLQSTPDRAVMIGDRIHSDLEPARKLGMRAILFGRKTDSVYPCATDYFQVLEIIRGFDEKARTDRNDPKQKRFLSYQFGNE